MRHLKYLALLGIFVALAAAPSPAQVSIGIHIGPDYGYCHVPPACPYGYYPDYPFGCAPYGYWGPEWFVDGVFVGAGPWYRFYYVQPVLYRRWYGPGYVYFPREHFHHFRDHDWDDDRRFHHFEGDHRFREHDFHRWDRDERHFRRVDGDRHFEHDRHFERERWDHDRGYHGEHGFREHDHGRDHGERHGHDHDGGGHGR